MVRFLESFDHGQLPFQSVAFPHHSLHFPQWSGYIPGRRVAFF